MKVLLYAIRLIALLMIVNGLNFLVDPAAAAEGLGMPLLDGEGRSTQIGDLSAFFLATGTLAAMGTYRGQFHWLYGAALLLGLAAVGRTLSSVLHGAPLVPAIAFEVVCTIVLLVGASRLPEGGEGR